MKRVKRFFTTLSYALITILVIYGIGYVKYRIWRAEHPQAKTWTFFIPKGKR